MKRLIAMVLITATIFVAAGCTEPEKIDGVTYPEEIIETIDGNPFIEFEDTSKAEKFAGFPIEVPEIYGYPIQYVQAAQNQLIQVMFFDKESAYELSKVIAIRKGIKTDNISGDYNEYENVTTITVNDIEVTVKGNDDKITVAIWNDGDFSYSITSDEALNVEMIKTLVQSIK